MGVGAGAGCTGGVRECREQERGGMHRSAWRSSQHADIRSYSADYAFLSPRSIHPPSRSPSQPRMPPSPPPPPPQLWKLKPEATLDELEGPSIIDAEVMPVALHYEDVHQFQVCVNKCEHNAPELPAEVIFCTHTH